MRRPLLAVLAPACLLAGCVDYLNNRDTVTFGAGNAAAANRAAHIEDPWNPDTRQTAIPVTADQALAARRLLILPPGVPPIAVDPGIAVNPVSVAPTAEVMRPAR